MAITALALLPAPAARADDGADRDEVVRALYDVELAIDAAKSDGDRAAFKFRDDPAKCREIVERGKRAGLQPTDAIDGKNGKYLFKRAGGLCDEYAHWKPLVEAAKIIAETISANTIARAVDPGDVKQEWIAGYRKTGEACLAKVDALARAGMPMDVVIDVNQEDLTIKDAAAKWCGSLLTWADGFAAATKVEEEKELARLAAIRDKWAVTGVKGERLDVLAENDGDAWYVNKGGYCTEIFGGSLKKTKVMFRWLSGGDWSHTLVRYEFKGDKLVRTSERFFDTRGKASQGCR